jgi:6-phosphogluconate dehydrogenase
MRDGQGRGGGYRGVFARWNTGAARELPDRDRGRGRGAGSMPRPGRPILDVIADRAGQKGTGRWTVIDAQRRAAPLPAVEAAVTARVLSGEAALRAEGARLFPGRALRPAQGRRARGRAIGRQDPRLFPGVHASVAGPGRGRLEPCRSIPWPGPGGRAASSGRPCSTTWRPRWRARPGRAPLAFAPGFSERIEEHLPALRRVIAAAVAAGLPVPALSAALQHFDQLRQARGTANMIQALRDRFGAHGFERTDRPGETGLHGPGFETLCGLSSAGRNGGTAPRSAGSVEKPCRRSARAAGAIR